MGKTVFNYDEVEDRLSMGSVLNERFEEEVDWYEGFEYTKSAHINDSEFKSGKLKRELDDKEIVIDNQLMEDLMAELYDDYVEQQKMNPKKEITLIVSNLSVTDKVLYHPNTFQPSRGIMMTYKYEIDEQE